MAITDIWGNRRRTTERNSNPDICGIFKSEMITAGSALRSCKSASKPCTALLTLYPADCSNMTILLRTALSSSTTKISYLAALNMDCLLSQPEGETDSPDSRHHQEEQFPYSRLQTPS